MPREPLDEAVGYPALVAVTCGDKQGVFLGGHTCFKTVSKREYYVRCECEECDGNMVWDVTNFEAHGGREHSKKPLQSIRTDGERCGLDMSLSKWLDNEDGVLGSSIVGKRYGVWWPVDQRWYPCTVTSWMPESAVHEVLYDDGDVEQLKWVAERTKPLPPGHDGDHGWGETEEEVAALLPAAPTQAAEASTLTPTAGAVECLMGLAGGPLRQQQPADSVAQRPGPSAQRGTGGSGRPEVGSGGEGAGPSQPSGSAPTDDVDLAFVLSKLPSQEHEATRQLFSKYRSLQAREAQWAAEVAEMQARQAQLRQECEEARRRTARLQELQRQEQACQRGIEEAQAALQASEGHAHLITQLTKKIAANSSLKERLQDEVAQGQPELTRLRAEVAQLRQAHETVAASQVPAQFRQLLQRAPPHAPGGAPGAAGPGAAPGPAYSAMGAN